jgi:hypothetical protein
VAELPVVIACSQCDREVDEFTAIAERWGIWSDGTGELVPFCPRREFAASEEEPRKEDAVRSQEA